MNTVKENISLFSAFKIYGDVPALADGCPVLGKLITFRKVRIEIVLPVEYIVPRYFTMTGQAHSYGKLHGFLIQFWQCTGMGQRNNPNICIGIAAKGSSICIVDLAIYQQLRVDFEADDGSIFFYD